jgi:site-specific DNA recombinase
VWQDVCTVLQHPERIQDALHRAQHGAWLPQDLHARRDNLRTGRTNLQQQVERLTDAYVRSVIPLEEYERRRADLEHKDRALHAQLQHLDRKADRHHELTGLATSINEFCQRVANSLATATFAQKRQLVMLLIDRVIVTDGDVDIRYVVPLSPESEHVRFSHLRKDYFHHPPARRWRKAP